jgi:hypothetical protein
MLHAPQFTSFRLAYQPPANSTFISEQTSHQQSASSTSLSKQTSTSHQSLAKRTDCLPRLFFFGKHVSVGFVDLARALWTVDTMFSLVS